MIIASPTLTIKGTPALGDTHITAPPDTLIEKAFELPAPVREPWVVTMKVAPKTDTLPHDADEEGFLGFRWDEIAKLPDGIYQLSSASDTSGFSPRWYGVYTQWLVIQGGEWRVLACYHAGGTWARWGMKTPYSMSKPTMEEEWGVLSNHPLLPREGTLSTTAR